MLEQFVDKFEGELYFQDKDLHHAIRSVYATDASEYQELPSAVAIPKCLNDIKLLVEFAGQSGIHLIPRAAGTSLAGQVVGSGIVVDISKHFTQILEINQEEKWVRVQPGVIRDDLNTYLKPFGLMYGPETSTSNRAMIGGMIGNNSCGLHSIVWGSARDHLISCQAILSDGSEVVFEYLSEGEFFSKCNQEDLEGNIYRGIYSILSDVENQKEIREGFPSRHIKRRNTGYALDFLLDQVGFRDGGHFNMCNIIAGSEGTLCIITEAKLQLMALPPDDVGMVAVHTNSIHDALLANLVALDYHCAASELVDHFILEFTKTNSQHKKNRTFIDGDPQAILMVEFFGSDKDNVLKKCHALITELKNKNLGYAYPILLGEETKKAWDVRKGGLGLLRNLPGHAKPVNLIEDFAVDPADLPEYIRRLELLLKSHKLQYAMYAHAGAGELHVEPIINLKTHEGIALFRTILTETASLAKSFGGSLSGEHGDGRLRGEFISYMMGQHNYQLFKEVKFIFDPTNVFNKGKIINAPPMDMMLRYKPEHFIHDNQTFYDFSDQGGFLRLAEKCSGSGDCRKTAVSGGTMCPSYMATRSEKDTTRARANILRQFLTRDETNIVNEAEVIAILDLCLSCKACKSECPSSVDVAKMKGEFLQGYYNRNGVPFRAKLIGNFSRLMALAATFPSVFNFMFRTTLVRRWINHFVGFHPERTMPLLSTEPLRSWYNKNKDIKNRTPHKTIYIFCDEFTNYSEAELGKKLIYLLKKLGYHPIIPDHVESGRAFMSKGMITKAREVALKNVKQLKSMITDATPMIGIEPSAILSFRDEYIDLMPPQLKNEAIKLSNNCLLFEEWFAREVDNGMISKTSFTTSCKNILLHGHCHQKALVGIETSVKTLSFPSNYQVNLIPSGCCGMAGSFGYEKEHYQISMSVGELVLFPTIRNTDQETVIAASGTSCRHQIADGTSIQSFHPIEILYSALAE